MTQYLELAAILVAINCVIVLGLNVQVGYAGMVNLMAIPCVAFGGYITMVLALPSAQGGRIQYILGLNWPFPLAVLGGVVASSLFAALVGSIALRRLRAYYFAIVTFCVAEILHQFIEYYKPIFNGSEGIFGLTPPLPAGLANFNLYYLMICLVVLALVYGLVEVLRRRPFGRALRAVREDQAAAAAFGRNVYLLELKAFVIGSAIAGLGGGLLVGFTGALDPNGWAPGETLLLLTALYVGGSGNNLGVVLGMVLTYGLVTQAVTFLPTASLAADKIAPLQLIAYGVILILVLRFRPAGLLPERVGRDSVPKETRGGGANSAHDLVANDAS
jgi:branched-chain amino acid transport system permease protein